MTTRGYTPPTLPEEEAVIWGDDTGRILPGIQYQLFGLLRRSMDRQTGIAGDRSSISYGGLYERVYQANAQGVVGTGNAWGETRDQRIAYIRGQVRQLEKTGLIRRLPRGKKLVVEFSIFIQNRDQYFSAQNVSSGFVPVISSGFAPPRENNKNNVLDKKNEDINGVCSGFAPGVCSTSPEVSINTTTATGMTRFENWKLDPLASAMLDGGMQEYTVATQLHIANGWRSIPGYSEASAVALINARLSKNPNVNSVNYFTGAIQQMCASALQEPKNGKSYTGKRHASRYESDSDRLEREAQRLGILH